MAESPAAELNRLKSAPPLAWPTVLLFTVCGGVIGWVWHAGIAERPLMPPTWGLSQRVQ